MVFRYDPVKDSYQQDMEGDGVVCSAVDILPTEFAKEVCGTFHQGFHFSNCNDFYETFKTKI